MRWKIFEFKFSAHTVTYFHDHAVTIIPAEHKLVSLPVGDVSEKQPRSSHKKWVSRPGLNIINSVSKYSLVFSSDIVSVPANITGELVMIAGPVSVIGCTITGFLKIWYRPILPLNKYIAIDVDFNWRF